MPVATDSRIAPWAGVFEQAVHIGVIEFALMRLGEIVGNVCELKSDPVAFGGRVDSIEVPDAAAGGERRTARVAIDSVLRSVCAGSIRSLPLRMM